MLQTNRFKDRLLEEKGRLENRIGSRRESSVQHGFSSINDSFSNSGDDEYADQATDVFEQQLDVSVLNKYRDRLQAVTKALARIDAGTYGRCIRCNTQISAARLDAIPETPYCRDCEQEVEVMD